MKYFRDSDTGTIYAFEDSVAAERDNDGNWVFTGDAGELPGPYPSTLEPTDDPTPPAYVPTLAELQAQRDTLLQLATTRIAPLQDAVDIGEATATEEAALTGWKKYRVALNRLDLTVTSVTWPNQPS